LIIEQIENTFSLVAVASRWIRLDRTLGDRLVLVFHLGSLALKLRFAETKSGYGSPATIGHSVIVL
jgi:hypothetical protein